MTVFFNFRATGCKMIKQVAFERISITAYSNKIIEKPEYNISDEVCNNKFRDSPQTYFCLFRTTCRVVLAKTM